MVKSKDDISLIIKDQMCLNLKLFASINSKFFIAHYT